MVTFKTLIAAGLLSLAGCATMNPSRSATADASAFAPAVEYAKEQRTTGLLIIQHGRPLVRENWPAPADPTFRIFDYGPAPDGQIYEDVASQQKSFVALLVAIAIDRHLVDVDRPISAWLGTGWSKATPEQESKIRLIDVLTMSSGLDEKFAYECPPGTRFFYNTPVYALTKRVLEAAARAPLATITRDWLTVPAGMRETDWRQRPTALGNVGNATGLVTTPDDTAIFGRIVLGHGVAPNGRRIVSRASLDRLFVRSATNPAYGRLWWLNGGSWVAGLDGKRREGLLVPSAPADMVAALGYLERRLYVVPSLDLVVVRTGASAPDARFDEVFWQKLAPALRR